MHSSGTGSEGLPLEGATELRHHRVTFELDDGAAVLRLDVPPPPSSELDTDGWSAMVRLTLVVADGPGDIGYLVNRLGPDLVDPAAEGWDHAAERDGAITVVFGAGPESPHRRLHLSVE